MDEQASNIKIVQVTPIAPQTQETQQSQSQQQFSKFKAFLGEMFNGRVNRTSFMFGFFILACAYALMFFNPLIRINPLSNLSSPVFWLWLLTIAPGVVVFTTFLLSICTKRLHDMNYSTTFVLMLIVPLVNLYFLAVMFFKGGTPEANAFGNPPPMGIHLKKMFGTGNKTFFFLFIYLTLLPTIVTMYVALTGVK